MRLLRVSVGICMGVSCGFVIPAADIAGQEQADSPGVARANSNERPAGVISGGVLMLRIAASQVRWHPEAEDGPFLTVETFGEEGGSPSIPGPLIRVASGTRVETAIRNALPDTLLVFGLSQSGGAPDTLRIPPGATALARMTAGEPGTYAYGGATIVGDSVHLLGTGNQLVGAFIVDGPEPRADRIFVMSIWPPAPGRFVMAINGKSWPHTERLDVNVGDSVHWRVINATRGRHPMHLHGFYFRIDTRGSWSADTVMADERPHVVTESVPYRGTFSMTWTAERPGNWLFHCHDALHTSWRRRFNLAGEPPPATLVMHGSAHHVEQDMSGLVLGIRVHGGPAAPVLAEPVRRTRVLVQETPRFYGQEPRFSYVITDSVAAERDGAEIPQQPLVLTRGDAAAITVVNEMSIPTAVHWHGIELESYFDGVPGWSGAGAVTAPLIEPGDSFIVRMTPPRAGTFIFHAHVDDMRQIALGLSNALVVLPPGQRWQPRTDHVFLISQLGRGRGAQIGINGSASPGPITVAAETVHRFRFINITIQDDAELVLSRDASSSDTSVIAWRALAKDGADLSAERVRSGSGPLRIAPGETYDFEVRFPAGDYRLRMKSFNDIDLRIHVPEAPPGRIAFTRVREDVNRPGDYRLEAEIWVMDADGSNARRITHNTSDDFGAVWSPDGRTIMFGAAQFAPDDSGALVLRTAHIYAIDAQGGEQRRVTPADMRAQFPSWSADGSRIAFHGSHGEGRAAFEIFTMNPDGTELEQLTNNDHVDARTDWSPDGRRIAFQSNRDGSTDIFVMNADGSGVTQLTTGDAPFVNQAPAWSPDGSRIVFQSDRDGNSEIYVMNSDGTGQTRVTQYPGRDVDPEWSGDGSRIAFDRDVSSDNRDVRQLYIMNPDGTNVMPVTGLPSSNGHAAWRGGAIR